MAVDGPELACEACQVIAVMTQEKLEDLAPPKGDRLALATAASDLVAASLGRKGPCSVADAWEPVATKLGVALEKAQQACRRQVQALEEPLETALADPALRDAKLREALCLAEGSSRRRRKPCGSLWQDSDVPVSKRRAAQLREAAARKAAADGEANERKARAFFAANAGRGGVETLASGLQLKVLQHGHGPGPPTLEQKVTVHYRGLLIDCVPQEGPVACKGGTEFDSTYSCQDGSPSAERAACEKNSPISFTGAQAGSFWPETLQRMQQGAKVEAYVPYSLAYGSVDDPNKRPAKVGPKAALVFQIELVKVHEVAGSSDLKITQDKREL